MRANQVDERSDQWIAGNPAFRVMLFESGGDVSWSVDTWELSDCGVLETIRWAQEHVKPRGAWAIGLVDTVTVPGTEELRRGFTFLEGADLNTQSKDLDAWEVAQVEAMLARLDKPVIRPEPRSTAASRESSGSDD